MGFRNRTIRTLEFKEKRTQRERTKGDRKCKSGTRKRATRGHNLQNHTKHDPSNQDSIWGICQALYIIHQINH